MANVVFLCIYLTIFTIILLIISVYISIKYFGAEKAARSYLISLFIYFFLMALVNLFQVIFLVLNPTIEYQLGIYNNYIVVCLIYFAPIPLIYQIERLYFSEKKILSKFHVITLLVLGTFIIFMIWTLGIVINNPNYFQNFEMGGGDYRYLNYASWAIIVFFICLSFLYLAIKSSGKYRQYSLIIAIGWGINQVINAITQLLPYDTVLDFNILTIIFIIKFAGAIITAYGFFKLYSISEYV